MLLRGLDEEESTLCSPSPDPALRRQFPIHLLLLGLTVLCALCLWIKNPQRETCLSPSPALQKVLKAGKPSLPRAPVMAAFCYFWSSAPPLPPPVPNPKTLARQSQGEATQRLLGSPPHLGSGPSSTIWRGQVAAAVMGSRVGCSACMTP